jgi:hypothetical protein
VARPRRDRAMGSSILASLSEAGGNDSSYPVNGPLPPHSLDDSDRRNATHIFVEAIPDPFLLISTAFANSNFQRLGSLRTNCLLAGKVNSGMARSKMVRRRNPFQVFSVAIAFDRTQLLFERRHRLHKPAGGDRRLMNAGGEGCQRTCGCRSRAGAA